MTGAELGARLRERDLTAAPAALNLLENRTPAAREQVAALLAEVSPARLGGEEIPVVVGGIIPDADVEPLKAAGVAAVYTPKDFELTRIMRDVVGLVAERNGVSAAA